MILLIANIVVFMVQIMTEQRNLDGMVVADRVVDSLGLIASDNYNGVQIGVRHGEIWRLVSYMFLHGSFMHIFFNMWALYMFGMILEDRIGAARFFNLYFISGLCGAGLWLIFNWNSPIPCIGASGAIFGVIVATAMFYPDLMVMLIIPPIPMKLKTMVILFAVVEVLFEISGFWTNVAHIAHLGGFAGGYLYIRYIYKNEVWDIFSIFKFKRKRGLYTMDNPPAGWSVSDKVSQAEVDRILDKISSKGINSLSEEEMETLRKAREQMRK